jgi:hypothetical protein
MNTEMPKISQQQMLVEVEMSNGKPFLIKFIAAEDGRLCVIARAMYGGQKREAHAKPFVEKRKHTPSKLKDRAKLPITNLDAPEDDAFRTPFISHIIQFNHYRVMK